ncbi:MAG: MCE family protein, partial [Neisseriaceae bacterium]|nr:MCE family protein [Neisseriaceae bacterium]
MTNQTTENEARRRPVSIISAVWLIPLTALIIGLWLMVTAILQRGEEITLRVPNADGIQEGSTVIKLLNVEVGRITKIALNEQRDGVILTAKINADIQDLLRDDTQFRIVRPRIDRSGISGLSTLVSGVYIDMVGGQSQKRQQDFTITDATTLSQYTNQEGVFIRLEGDADKLIPAGSPVLYHQIEVGEVESVR